MVSIKIIANINILINKNIQDNIVGTAVAEKRNVDVKVNHIEILATENSIHLSGESKKKTVHERVGHKRRN